MPTLLLRLALAFAFAYPAYGFWSAPANWVGFLPPFVKNLEISEPILLTLLAIFHLVVALWILSGWRIFIPSLVAALFLGSIVFFNLTQIDILFRDVSLALAALSLALLTRAR